MKRYYITSATVLIAGLALAALGYTLPEIVDLQNTDTLSAGDFFAKELTLTVHSENLFMLGVAVALCALFCLIFRKTVQNNCSVRTSAVALALSAVSVLGTSFALGGLFYGSYESTALLTVDAIVALLCLCGFILLLGLYTKLRVKNPSAKGIVIDILFAFLYLIPLFLTGLEAHDAISKLI